MIKLVSCLSIFLMASCFMRTKEPDDVAKYEIIKKDKYLDLYVFQCRDMQDTIIVYSYADALNSCIDKRYVRKDKLSVVGPNSDINAVVHVYGLNGDITNIGTESPGSADNISLTYDNKPPYFISDCSAFLN